AVALLRVHPPAGAALEVVPEVAARARPADTQPLPPSPRDLLADRRPTALRLAHHMRRVRERLARAGAQLGKIPGATDPPISATTHLDGPSGVSVSRARRIVLRDACEGLFHRCPGYGSGPQFRYIAGVVDGRSRKVVPTEMAGHTQSSQPSSGPTDAD